MVIPPFRENPVAFAATVEALTNKAAELETRVNEIHQALAEINEQMQSVSDALHRLARSAAASPATEDEPR
ncbi:hypothetical protein ACIHCM_10210 [Streptomyces sp. NPDC052023]|uniref:hypothetical protein n=1 Tax=Streptomyces sp. NPDC052023 TaxID=3365681 RepID=UPI0037D98A95